MNGEENLLTFNFLHFSPTHPPSILLLILIHYIKVFISNFRREVTPPFFNFYDSLKYFNKMKKKRINDEKLFSFAIPLKKKNIRFQAKKKKIREREK